MTVAERLATFAVGLLLATSVRAAETAPHTLLDRMNEAVRLLDYEGRFVVQVGNQLDAMYIVHRLDGGAEKERVVSLTGKPREIIRSDQAVACLVPGRSKPINVGRQQRGRSVSPLQGVDAEQLNAFYDIRLHGTAARVAGREAHQLTIEPRDGYRFGYRLYIDRESALPLRTVMLDGQQQVVSQMMFVELRVNDGITPIEHDLAAMQVARGNPTAAHPRQRLAPPDWSFTELPPGFHLNVHRRRVLDDGSEREHFIFSDGLATVSVYVQAARAEGGLQGVSRMGAAQAVGRVIAGHEVIVVGEVPLQTLEWFAARIEAVDT